MPSSILNAKKIFKNCYNLKGFPINESLINFKSQSTKPQFDYAFENCSNLDTYVEPNLLWDLSGQTNFCFKNCNKLNLFELPSSWTGLESDNTYLDNNVINQLSPIKLIVDITEQNKQIDIYNLLPLSVNGSVKINWGIADQPWVEFENPKFSHISNNYTVNGTYEIIISGAQQLNFANNTNIISAYLGSEIRTFNNLFANCSNLQTVIIDNNSTLNYPQTILSSFINEINVYQMFNSCSALTTLDNLKSNQSYFWFENNKITNYYDCFTGCTNLNVYDLIPADWKGNDTSAITQFEVPHSAFNEDNTLSFVSVSGLNRRTSIYI